MQSSLLETISGINLPKGDGMVTKVPLELQLRHSSKKMAKLFYSNQEKTVQNLSDISMEILKVQQELIGENKKDVRDEVIQLQIFSPSLPDLTLTDLPGLIHNIAPGQDADLPDRIQKLTEKHTQGHSKVILCIVPGNVDPSTCKALNIAEKQDPKNERTICVITKVDMGLKSDFNISSVVEHLEDKNLEFVAVRNRTSKEVISGLSIQDLRNLEQIMIEEELGEIIPKDYCGIGNLINRLVEILRERLWQSLDDVVQKVENALQEAEAELSKLPPSMENKYQAHRIYSKVLEEIQNEFQELARQPSSHKYQSLISKNNELKEEIQLTTTAMLEFEFKEFLKMLENNFNNPKFLDKNNIDNIVNLSKPFSGTQLPNFPIYSVPLQLYKLFLWSKLKQPSQKLKKIVHERVKDLLFEIVKRKSDKYPKLSNQLNNKIKAFENKIQKTMDDKLDELLNLEKLPYTQARTYIDDVKRWEELFSKKMKENSNVPSQGTEKNNNPSQGNGRNIQKMSFGISTIIPKLGKSWVEQASDLLDYINDNPTNDNLEAMQIIFSLASIAGVLFQRFVDNLCLTIRHVYLEELPQQITEECNMTEDQAWQLLRNEGVEKKRANLLKEKENYLEALQELRNCY